MAKQNNKLYIGMNKGGHDASICIMYQKSNDTELIIKERFSRIKKDGHPIQTILKPLTKKLRNRYVLIGENSYHEPPSYSERLLEKQVNFHKQFKKSNLKLFFSYTNPKVKFLTHHYAHALSALATSPFEKSLVVVLDGAGSIPQAFDKNNPEIKIFRPTKKQLSSKLKITESMTVYLQNGKNIKCVEKKWQTFPRYYSPTYKKSCNGIGTFYEISSLYIFNSEYESGKVMGLAPFGKFRKISNIENYFVHKDWSRSFKKVGKKAWEASREFQYYANIAASVQSEYERYLFKLLKYLRKKYPNYNNLILTGGCALNCSANGKIVQSGLFKKIYVPPYPSDEGISLGIAAHLKFIDDNIRWKPTHNKNQISFLGSKTSIPNNAKIQSVFSKYKITKPTKLTDDVAQLLNGGATIAWMQGRSETGPRALGHRSLLASPTKKGMKDYLNNKIKGREFFRPYGCTVLQERVSKYFEVSSDFESPFMSFAVPVRNNFKKILSEVTHIDGTSRIQTLHPEQDQLFYELIQKFEILSGVACLLNTSLNVMGEPMVETVEDAKRFFDLTPVDAIVVNQYLIQRKN